MFFFLYSVNTHCSLRPLWNNNTVLYSSPPYLGNTYFKKIVFTLFGYVLRGVKKKCLLWRFSRRSAYWFIKLIPFKSWSHVTFLFLFKSIYNFTSKLTKQNIGLCCIGDRRPKLFMHVSHQFCKIVSISFIQKQFSSGPCGSDFVTVRQSVCILFSRCSKHIRVGGDKKSIPGAGDAWQMEGDQFAGFRSLVSALAHHGRQSVVSKPFCHTFLQVLWHC